MLYIHDSVVWVGVLFFAYWNLFKCYSNALTSLVSFILATTVRHAVGRLLNGVEWACGVHVPATEESLSISHVLEIDLDFLRSMITLIALIFFAGSKAMIAWWEALVIVVAISCWASRVERHVSAWEQRTQCRFRVFTFVSGFLALLSAVLHWSFFATSTRPRDDVDEIVYYALVLWTLTLSAQLLQLLTFVALHVFYAVTAQGRSVGGFDPTEKVGLTVRSVKAAVSCLAALMYCSDEATAFMKLAVMCRLFLLINDLSTLRRFDNVLHPFPEVSLSGYCVICQEAIRTDERARRMQCGHVFHSRCLHRWLMRAQQCPMCRHPAPALRNDAAAGLEVVLGPRGAPDPGPLRTRNTAVQTTFEPEHNTRRQTVYGSLRPLARSNTSATELAPPHDDDNSVEGVVNPRPIAPLLPSPQTSRRSSPCMNVSLAPPAVVATETDEFSDNPIVSSRGMLSGRKRRHIATTDPDGDLDSINDVSEDCETSLNATRDKKVKLEEWETDPIG